MKASQSSTSLCLASGFMSIGVSTSVGEYIAVYQLPGFVVMGPPPPKRP